MERRLFRFFFQNHFQSSWPTDFFFIFRDCTFVRCIISLLLAVSVIGVAKSILVWKQKLLYVVARRTTNAVEHAIGHANVSDSLKRE
jgi:hypothetical protein